MITWVQQPGYLIIGRAAIPNIKPAGDFTAGKINGPEMV
jgi:hypothetical protein